MQKLLKIKTIVVSMGLAFSVSSLAITNDDPGRSGPYSVKSERYNLGDSVVKVRNFRERVEAQGIVHFPVLARGDKTKMPVIMITHGRFDSCFSLSASDDDNEEIDENDPDFEAIQAERESNARQRQRDGQDEDELLSDEEDELLDEEDEGDFSGGDQDAAFDFGWPCADGFKPYPQYLGFNYLAEHLASQGFFVVSIASNGINGQELPDEPQPLDNGASSRAELMDYHLGMWRAFNNRNAGPLKGVIKSKLKDKLDFSRIGLLGHSRGGDATIAFLRLNENKTTGKYRVKAVMPVASTYALTFPVIETSTAVVTAYCDGDVKNAQNVAIFDKALYPVKEDTGPVFANRDDLKGNSRHPHFMYLMMGANHNFFNSVLTFGGHPATPRENDWTHNSDPFCGLRSKNNGRFSPAKQRAALKAYAGAYFNTMMMGEEEAEKNLPILTGDVNPPRASRLTKNDIHESFHMPAKNRLDIDRVGTATDLIDNGNSVRRNDLGGAVRKSRTMRLSVCNENFEVQDSCISNESVFGERARQLAHNRYAFGSNGLTGSRGSVMLALNWNKKRAYYETDLRRTDARPYDLITFRAGLDFTKHPRGKAVKSMRVTLTDVKDNAVTVDIDNTEALYFPPGSERLTSQDDNGEVDDPILPKSILSTVKVSLKKFKGKGLEMRHLKSMRITLNNNDKGAMFISDLAFVELPDKL